MSVWEKRNRGFGELEGFALVVLVLVLVMESLSSYLGRNGSASVSLAMVKIVLEQVEIFTITLRCLKDLSKLKM